MKLVEKDGKTFAMKIFEPPKDKNEKEKFIKDTQMEFNTVKDAEIPEMVRYEEFVTDAKWRKKNGTDKEDKDVCYITMELISGCTLSDFFD